MFVGSFEGDFNQFQTDTVAAITAFQAQGVTHLIIDLTNNGGENRKLSILTIFSYFELYFKVDLCVSDSSCTSILLV